ncbi:Crp/Fnr family transcriptional regulator [Pedococcus sp. 5OH_020]|uniref:Crp/Fnr family transcriptional regulator n=1 Tax=Pedococcus sp. 5OH_020 TaxID=2989814 RepID=UPI0022E9E431|nr:Crp/Fnr family transcriptional regulator [Pedococcus sp. 5OH_020]
MEWHLLSGLTEQDRTRVLELMTRRCYRRGETVLHEGDASQSVHFVVEGHVLVRRTTASGDRAAFTVLGAGDAFGELALLAPNARRSSSVVALEPVVTLVLGADDFRVLVDGSPAVNRLLVDVLAAQVRRLSDHLMEALYSSVEERVVGRLRDLCRIYGAPQGRVVLPIRQTDLAEMAGASRPATNRVLRRLADEGSVVLSRGHIQVLRPRGLAPR